MKDFKLHTDIAVLSLHRELIFPDLTHEESIIRSVNFTPNTNEKLEMLRAKYKISRSALIRILIDSVEL